MKYLIHGLTKILLYTLIITGSAQANQLVNSGFEDHPHPSLGNNLSNSNISPWMIKDGGAANVVKVDSGKDWKGIDQGPWSDAKNRPYGEVRHYLDIANAGNSFYQTFKSNCKGKATFGGFFSTRDNQSGSATVTLREGDINGQIIGVTNQVDLPAGDSAHDPWEPVSFTVPIQAATYTLEVWMNNQMNFDQGFVNIPECDGPGEETDPNGYEKPETKPKDYTFDPCCPPINAEVIADMLRVVPGQSAPNDPYHLVLDPKNYLSPGSTTTNPISQLGVNMQHYINYIHAITNGGLERVVTLIKFHKVDSNGNVDQTHVPVEHYYVWEGGVATNNVNFGKMILPNGIIPLNKAIPKTAGLIPGQKYRMTIFNFLEHGNPAQWDTDYLDDKKCNGEFLTIIFDIKVGARSSTPQIQILDKNNKVIR